MSTAAQPGDLVVAVRDLFAGRNVQMMRAGTVGVVLSRMTSSGRSAWIMFGDCAMILLTYGTMDDPRNLTVVSKAPLTERQ